ncbi:MAG: ABC transporter ATP-binding protein [Planctomycetes bacterium]|nr:ABC transporter ATP-binding protein [Planctomycetota bacterium]
MHVQVVNLKKHFGRTKAVDDISFDFSDGQIVGFVGPNGAGKTTTMQIISTLDTPTAGDIYLNNVSVVQYPEKARRLVGFMPDSLPTHRDITVDDYLDFFARAFGIRCNRRHKVVEGIEEFTNLLGIRDKFLKTLSKGMKQRVSLARALIHDPGVLVLDEPASGLDPRARIELRELLKALSEQNKAIIISSHILSELAEICDSAVIIERGKLLKAGTLDEITPSQAHCTVLIRTIGKLKDLYKKMLQTPTVIDARIVGTSVEVEIDGSEEETADLIEMLVNDGYRIVEAKHVRAGLEDIFMQVTKGELN